MKMAAFNINQSVNSSKTWDAKPQPTLVEAVDMYEW